MLFGYSVFLSTYLFCPMIAICRICRLFYAIDNQVIMGTKYIFLDRRLKCSYSCIYRLGGRILWKQAIQFFYIFESARLQGEALHRTAGLYRRSPNRLWDCTGGRRTAYDCTGGRRTAYVFLSQRALRRAPVHTKISGDLVNLPAQAWRDTDRDAYVLDNR